MTAQNSQRSEAVERGTPDAPIHAERIAVIGGGMMGVGVAQVFAAAGHEVALQDVYDEALERVPGALTANLSFLAEHGLFPADGVEDAVGRVRTTSDLIDAADGADVVVECVFEDLALKQERLRAARRRLPAGDHPLHQHLGHEHHRDRREGAAQGARRRHALLEPAVPDPAGRGRAHRARRPGRGGPHHGPAAPGRQAPDRLQEGRARASSPTACSTRCGARPSRSSSTASPTPATVDESIRFGPGLRLPILAPMENADMVGLDLTLAIHDYILPHLEASPRAVAAADREGGGRRPRLQDAARGSPTGRRRRPTRRASGWSRTWCTCSATRSEDSERTPGRETRGRENVA